MVGPPRRHRGGPPRAAAQQPPVRGGPATPAGAERIAAGRAAVAAAPQLGGRAPAPQIRAARLDGLQGRGRGADGLGDGQRFQDRERRVPEARHRGLPRGLAEVRRGRPARRAPHAAGHGAVLRARDAGHHAGHGFRSPPRPLRGRERHRQDRDLRLRPRPVQFVAAQVERPPGEPRALGVDVVPLPVLGAAARLCHQGADFQFLPRRRHRPVADRGVDALGHGLRQAVHVLADGRVQGHRGEDARVHRLVRGGGVPGSAQVAAAQAELQALQRPARQVLQRGDRQHVSLVPPPVRLRRDAGPVRVCRPCHCEPLAQGPHALQRVQAHARRRRPPPARGGGEAPVPQRGRRADGRHRAHGRRPLEHVGWLVGHFFQ
mmetsp:Transcript_19890/g.59524  ORF Transcript_19890/g.59524 Transcript_19890/m.59524 type:complete len:376 (+) Transcript_19890:1129-2256(+)